jgi:hypothetical protein
VKKHEKPKFYGQNRLLSYALPFSPWAILATWMYVGTSKKIQEK